MRESMYDVQPYSFTFDPVKDKSAASLMNDTWNYIAGDCFVGDDGEVDESMTMTREDVVELVMDADRMTHSYNGDMEVAAYAVWAHRYHEDHFQQEIVKKAFPYETFCY